MLVHVTLKDPSFFFGTVELSEFSTTIFLKCKFAENVKEKISLISEIAYCNCDKPIHVGLKTQDTDMSRITSYRRNRILILISCRH